MLGAPSQREIDAALAQIFALPDGPKVAAMFQILAACRSGFRKGKVLPVKRGLDFEILVAQVMARHVPVDDEDVAFEALDARTQLLLESRSLLSQSRLCLGPYGDLFYRVLVAYGGGLDQVIRRRYGMTPTMIGPDDVGEPPDPPLLEAFLTSAGHRFVEALAGDDARMSQGELTATIHDLADRLGDTPLLIRALVGATPLAVRAHPQPGWAGSLTFEECLDAIGDPDLARELSTTDPV